MFVSVYIPRAPLMEACICTRSLSQRPVFSLVQLGAGLGFVTFLSQLLCLNGKGRMFSFTS